MRFRWIPPFLVLAALLLSSCRGTVPTTNLPDETAEAETATAVFTPTKAPTDTPTPSPPAFVLLVSGDSDHPLRQEVESTLRGLASEEGIRFEVLQSPDPSFWQSAGSIVISLPPSPGIEQLARDAPQAQFLAVLEDIEPGENLSVIHSGGDWQERAAFLAGYIGALITPDWRVGIIRVAGETDEALTAFQNGFSFFCGWCRQSYPPFYEYPVTIEISSGAGEAEQRSAADRMVDFAVETVYITPAALSATLVDSLTAEGIRIIGPNLPASAAKSQWAASIQPDTIGAVEDIWNEIRLGSGGLESSPKLMITDVDGSHLSEGRLRLAEEVLAGLESGTIIPSDAEPLPNSEE